MDSLNKLDKKMEKISDVQKYRTILCNKRYQDEDELYMLEKKINFITPPDFLKEYVKTLELMYEDNKSTYHEIEIDSHKLFELYRELGYTPSEYNNGNKYECFISSGTTDMPFDFHQEKDESPHSMTLVYYFENNCVGGNFEYILPENEEYIPVDGITFIPEIEDSEDKDNGNIVSIDIRKHNCFLFNSEISHRGTPITSGKRAFLSLHVTIK